MKKYFLLMILGLLFVNFTAYADVKINEIVPKGAGGVEWVELYNTSGSPISLDGWKIQEYVDTLSIDLSGRTIPANDFDTVNLSYVLDNNGDIVYLVDDSGDTIDLVGFGIR